MVNWSWGWWWWDSWLGLEGHLSRITWTRSLVEATLHLFTTLHCCSARCRQNLIGPHLIKVKVVVVGLLAWKAACRESARLGLRPPYSPAQCRSFPSTKLHYIYAFSGWWNMDDQWMKSSQCKWYKWSSRFKRISWIFSPSSSLLSCPMLILSPSSRIME